MGETVLDDVVEIGETACIEFPIALTSSKMVSIVIWRGANAVSSASAGEEKEDAREAEVGDEQEIGEARTGLLEMKDEESFLDSPTKFPGNLSLANKSGSDSAPERLKGSMEGSLAILGPMPSPEWCTQNS